MFWISFRVLLLPVTGRFWEDHERQYNRPSPLEKLPSVWVYPDKQFRIQDAFPVMHSPDQIWQYRLAQKKAQFGKQYSHHLQQHHFPEKPLLPGGFQYGVSDFPHLSQHFELL